jgi:hypothetical protein
MNSTNPNFKEWFHGQVDKIKQEKGKQNDQEKTRVD